MIVFLILCSLWLLLMQRSMVAEYRYYHSVRELEPQVWQQLGSPTFLKIPMVFISPKGQALLKTITNERINKLAKAHRQSGMLFIGFLALALTAAIIYFKLG